MRRTSSSLATLARTLPPCRVSGRYGYWRDRGFGSVGGGVVGGVVRRGVGGVRGAVLRVCGVDHGAGGGRRVLARVAVGGVRRVGAVGWRLRRCWSGASADRVGVRWLMAGGSLVGAAGLLAFAAATAGWQVLAVWWVVLGPVTALTFYEPAYVAIQQAFARAGAGARDRRVDGGGGIVGADLHAGHGRARGRTGVARRDAGAGRRAGVRGARRGAARSPRGPRTRCARERTRAVARESRRLSRDAAAVVHGRRGAGLWRAGGAGGASHRALRGRRVRAGHGHGVGRAVGAAHAARPFRVAGAGRAHARHGGVRRGAGRAGDVRGADDRRRARTGSWCCRSCCSGWCSAAPCRCAPWS